MTISATQVKVIYSTPKSDQDISEFIDIAEMVVAEQLSDKGLSAERLDKITLYLTAHFLCVSEENGGLKSQKMGESTETYATPTGDVSDMFGYKATRFGQQAIALDTSGSLAAESASAGLKAQFRVV